MAASTLFLIVLAGAALASAAGAIVAIARDGYRRQPARPGA
ncbi:MAG: hypothetical protein QM635_05025 [Microbacteriaceae bacterium]